MDKKINSATESREYLIQEMKKQLVGPQDGHFTEGVASFQFNPNNPERHKQEILTKSPRLTYTAGTLFPQQSTVLGDEPEGSTEENFEEETDQKLLLNELENLSLFSNKGLYVIRNFNKISY